MKKSKRDITKRLRFNDEQAKRLDSYLQMRKFTFTDFTHSLIKSELDRLGWLCNENSPFEAIWPCLYILIASASNRYNSLTNKNSRYW